METALLLTTNALLSASAALVMFVVLFARKTYPGFALWATGVLCLAVGAALLIPGALPPMWGVRMLRNAILIGGYLLILRGMLLFRECRVSGWLEGFFALAFIPLFGYYSLDPSALGIRIVIYSAFAGTLCLATVAVTLRQRPAYFGSNDILLAVWMSVFGLFHFFRIANQLGSPAQGTAFETLGGVGNLYAMGQLLTVQLVTLTLVSMNSQRLEHELREREESLEFVLAGSRLGTWDWNIVTGEVKRNEYWGEMLGFDRKEVDDGKVNGWLELIHPEERDRAWAWVNEQLAGSATVYEIEYRMLDSANEYRWIRDRARVVRRDSNGRPLRMSGTHEDITLRKEAERKRELLANIDPLTDTWNRRHLEHVADIEMKRALRLASPLSLILFDIDHFKSINDTLGPVTGDQVLMRVSGRIANRIRVTDMLARWGGDEFVILLPHTNGNEATMLAEELRTLMEEPFEVIGKVRASFGVTEYRPHESFGEWFKRVDEALYSAKAAGRNTVHLGK